MNGRVRLATTGQSAIWRVAIAPGTGHVIKHTGAVTRVVWVDILDVNVNTNAHLIAGEMKLLCNDRLL